MEEAEESVKNGEVYDAWEMLEKIKKEIQFLKASEAVHMDSLLFYRAFQPLFKNKICLRDRSAYKITASLL